MIRDCDAIFDVRLSQQQLRELYERNPALAKLNPAFNATPTAMADKLYVNVVKDEARPRSKYGNVKVEFEGMKFDSKKELRCWQELQLRYRAREIFFLERQVAYDLIVSGVKIGRFTADFRWFENDQEIVADCKSPATRKETAYRLRKKIWEAQYAPLVIREL